MTAPTTASSDADRLFDAHGDVRAAGADRRILLDADGAWLVRTGRVDLFAVRLRDGEPAGGRLHVVRVEAGSALFGADIHGPDGLTLIAVGGPGTTVSAIGGAAARALAREPAYRATLGTLLDGWATALSAGAAHAAGVRPKRCADVAPVGGETTIERGACVAPAGGVAWITVLAGGVRVVGEAAATVVAGESLPLGAGAWLDAPDGATIQADDAATALATGDPWGAVRRLHGVTLDCVAAAAARAAAAERERLRTKAGARRETLAAAISRLLATMDQTPPAELPARRRPAGALADEDALFAACRLIGATLGITMRRETAAGERSPLRDPLTAIARASRVRMRRVALRDGWWREDNGPLLARVAEGQRPVALLATKSGYVLHDPVARTEQRVDETVAATLAPFAHALYRPFADVALGIRDVVRFGLRGCGADVRMVVLMGAAVGLLGMVTPLATGALFNTVIPDAERAQLTQLTLVLLIAAAASALFQLTRSVALLRIEARMGAAVQAAVWDRLLSLPMPFFRRFSAGDLAVRAMGIDEIRRTLSGAVMAAVISGVFSVFNFALLFTYDASLALWATLLVGVALAAALGAGFLQLRSQRAGAALRSKTSGVVLQLLTGAAKIKTVGAEVQAFDLWARLFGGQRDQQFRARRYGNAYAAFSAAFPVLASLVIFAVGTRGTQAHTLGTGDFLAFIVAFNMALAATLATSNALIGALSAVPLYEQAKPILHTRPEVDTGKADPGELSGAIALQHVNFRYHTDGPPVLRDVSVRIEPGEFVAFVGPSGSGKSTILRLLLGFEVAEAGALFYDDQDLAGLDVQAVRQQIGVVLQSGRLMAGDLFTNIVGSSSATLDDAWEAARMAGLDGDVREMPMGMHTVVSEGGGTLSGGQRQRLMIARAIVNRPRLLFFDEATSALDNRTQEIVSRSLDRLRATRVVIAHRLSTIVHADRIYVVQAGEIVEHGRYDELMTRGGLFSALARRQLA